MKYCFINTERDAVTEYFHVPTAFSYSDQKVWEWGLAIYELPK